MEMINAILSVASIIVMIGGLVWHAAYFKGQFGERMKNIQCETEELKNDLKGVKERVMFRDTCDSKHEEINRRLDRDERALNGWLKGAES